MEFTQTILLSGLALLALAQFVLVVLYCHRLLKPATSASSEHDLPRVAVILCLRGSDPFLEECIRALFQLQYPRYRVHFVFDHPNDPAMKILMEAVGDIESSRYQIHLIDPVRTDSGLKCQALVAVVHALDPDVEAIALVDADTIVFPEWLQMLVAPMTDPEIGATTGSRFFDPRSDNGGSVVRSLWNTAAVVQMYFYNVGWGGTLAIKMAALRESGMLEDWQRSLFEDTMTERYMNRIGLRLLPIADLIMPNRERFRFDSNTRWIRRQLLDVRLYHSKWRLVFVHGIGTSLMLSLTTIFVVFSLAIGNWYPALYTTMGILIYQLANILMAVMLDYSIRSAIERSHQSVRAFSLMRMIRQSLWIPATQLIYALAAASAIVARRVLWRGITYQIRGPFEIEMDEYRRYEKN